jgi:hypothetical protein
MGRPRVVTCGCSAQFFILFRGQHELRTYELGNAKTFAHDTHTESLISFTSFHCDFKSDGGGHDRRFMAVAAA